MKKILSSLFLLTIMLIAGCSNDDELSGRTFDLAYPPGPVSEGDGMEDHNVFMTLSFDDGKVVREDGNEVEGQYDLDAETLSILFEHDEETLNVEFDEFNGSDRTFSAYNAIVSNATLDKSEGELSYLMTLGNEFSMQFPVEFIEK
ncbi:hypothetical protein [Salinicoccus bachuensis]|uniref:Uncharacterized protein n=1 Tax=Salinicoccus bachuensis TaxID=3136731 RepID=A0ABZ3CM76_9STAP